jgi:hypothetical protein
MLNIRDACREKEGENTWRPYPPFSLPRKKTDWENSKKKKKIPGARIRLSLFLGKVSY